jgi:hypothetical protein
MSGAGIRSQKSEVRSGIQDAGIGEVGIAHDTAVIDYI